MALCGFGGGTAFFLGLGGSAAFRLCGGLALRFFGLACGFGATFFLGRCNGAALLLRLCGSTALRLLCGLAFRLLSGQALDLRGLTCGFGAALLLGRGLCGGTTRRFRFGRGAAFGLCGGGCLPFLLRSLARGFRAALFRGLCRCAPFLLRLCRSLTFGFRGSVRRGLALAFGGGLAVCLGGSLAFRLGCGFGGRIGRGLTRGGGGSRIRGRLTRSLGRSRLRHAAVEGFDQVGRPVLGAARGVKRQRRSRGDRNCCGVGRRQRRAVRLSLCHGGRGVSGTCGAVSAPSVWFGRGAGRSVATSTGAAGAKSLRSGTDSAVSGCSSAAACPDCGGIASTGRAVPSSAGSTGSGKVATAVRSAPTGPAPRAAAAIASNSAPLMVETWVVRTIGLGCGRNSAPPRIAHRIREPCATPETQ